MVAKIDYNMEEDTSCLMLISKVGQRYEEGDQNRVFTCKTCLKEFSSFQALGGHRASHTKPTTNSGEDKSSSISKKVKTPTSHVCPICGVDFPLGQALGGHMRKHRNDKASDAALVTRSFLPEEATVTTLKQTNSGKRVAFVDSENTQLNLNLELGWTIY